MDRSKLNRALSSDDAPTPGYLYGEIARMTQTGPDVAGQVVDYILTRLRKGNHNTKFKALVVIKQVCRTARSDFRPRLQRQNAEVKECLQYRGPPDPLRGDAIYKRVREAAKEALEAIFNEEDVSAPAPLANGRIQGFGSGMPEDGHGGPGGAYGNPGVAGNLRFGMNNMVSAARDRMDGGGAQYMGGNDRRTNGGNNFGGSASGMQGFGNPNFQDMRGQTSMLDKLGSAAASLGKTVTTQVPSLRALRMPGSTKSSLTGFDGPPPGNLPSNRGPEGDRWTGGGGYNPNLSGGGYGGNQGGYSGGGMGAYNASNSGAYGGPPQPSQSTLNDSYYNNANRGGGGSSASFGIGGG
eukprot:CAMPEP_0118876576 /NCGR_PEP_ID=MMETSP1163-20130328/17213_1 /TAXON_ID=124430 /ORGANISM="Phaeomonas parva, Strain CCMP2877" /LENGTH=352 /DNA_ID=CAMNT_0006812195 /DNA_START=253 /DNA_END=1307 /DNA_ORIENTATION=-